MDSQRILLRTTSKSHDIEQEIQEGLYQIRTEGRRIEAIQELKAISDVMAFVRPWKSKKMRME